MQVMPYDIGRMPPFLVREPRGVYLRSGSPYWIIRFRYKGRLIRESTRLRSRRQALAYQRRRMAEFGLGTGYSDADVPTLSAAANALLAHIAASRKAGYAQVRSHLRSLIEYFGAHTRIAEILPERMERYVTERRVALRDASVYNELSTLRRCIRLQWRRGRILVLPEFPMPKRGRARQGFFTAEEVERLCDHLPAHAVNAVRFAWETGWRRGEISPRG